MRVEEKRGGKEDRGKILEMVIGSGCKDAGLFGKRGATKREDERKDGGRAMGFEKRLEEGRGSRIARMYWEEIRERVRKGKGISGWEKERRSFFEDRGVGTDERGRREGEGMD